jgi:hypothetical protein
MNKRYSYPRVMAIRIDVHPAGKNQTNTPHASHAVNIWQPFVKSSTDLYRSTTHEKKCSRNNSQLDDHLIRGFIFSFSPTTTNEAVGKRQASIENQLLVLLVHITGMRSVCLIPARGGQPIGP